MANKYLHLLKNERSAEDKSFVRLSRPNSFSLAILRAWSTYKERKRDRERVIFLLLGKKTSLSVIVRIFAKVIDRTNNILGEKLKWRERERYSTTALCESVPGQFSRTAGGWAWESKRTTTTVGN